MSEPILEIRNLTKEFPGVIALENVSFSVEPGTVHALCGENGAGKSTLIKILAGVHPFGTYRGDFHFEGGEARFSTIADSERVGIGVIHQELALIGEMTVAENIFLGSEPTLGPFELVGRIDWNRIRRETQRLLDQLGLAIDPDAQVNSLGIGAQQLVEIAKALSKNSRVLLLDEPTAALTDRETETLLGIVRGLRDSGVSCIYISHKLDEVFALADSITVLRDGVSVCTTRTEETSKQAIIREMVGRELGELFPRRRTDPGEVRLVVENLTVTEPVHQRTILHDLSFEVRAGEVVGFGGLMGAGRTELLMHLFANVGHRSSGRVLLDGEPLLGNDPEESIERGLILISEDRKRYGLFLEQEIAFHFSISSWLGRSFARTIDHEVETRETQDQFTALRVKAPSLESSVSGLSGGNQQKVVLGKGLRTDPSIIFLDEPTRGIDVGAKVELYELINLFKGEGKAVLLVSSELPELMAISDRIVILSEGRIGGEFTHDSADQESILTAAMAHTSRIS